ncbi:MAG: single-stranded DNA-binding protein [Planctomycetes bacterium]|nr:single-stranded DNA-binding protein [Planctomycetota bacterium]
MTFNLNSVTLAGNLTRDPEIRNLPSDQMVVNFGLAVNRRWKGPDGEFKEETTFIDVESWGRTAELVGQYLTKGSPVYLEGRLKLDQWQDKDNQKRSKLKVVANTVQFLPSNRNRGAPGEAGASDAAVASGATGDESHAVAVAGPSHADAPRPKPRPQRTAEPAGAYTGRDLTDQPPF